MTTPTLLERYARDGDESAFSELVEKHLRLVNAAALRRLNGDVAAALDVTQTVFLDLALRAKQIDPNIPLAGWLHQHTCFIAAKAVRGDQRRRAREQTMVEMHEASKPDEQLKAISSVLDEAIQTLPPEHRAAIILRFFEARGLRSVAEELRITEEAAQKRVQRGLERLRAVLTAKGISLSVAALESSVESLAATANPAASPELVLEFVRSQFFEQRPVSAPPRAWISTPKLALFSLILAIPVLWWAAALLLPQSAQPSPNEMSPTPLQFGSESARNEITPSQPFGVAGDEMSRAGSPIPAPSFETPTQSIVTVFDKFSKTPLQGVSVIVSIPAKSGVQATTDSATVFTTDSDGRAILPFFDSKPSTITWEFLKPGYGGWLCAWDLTVGDALPKAKHVWLEPGVEIGGLVLDADRQPIHGVHLQIHRRFVGDEDETGNDRRHLRSSAAFPSGRILTDITGRWATTNVPASMLDRIGISYSHPAHAGHSVMPKPTDIDLLTNKAFVVTLSVGTRLSGYVVDNNNMPVAGAEIELGASSDAQRKTKTDSTGFYELSFLPSPSKHELSVMAEGYTPVLTTVQLQGRSVEQSFVLHQGTALRGVVLDKQGLPVSGVVVGTDHPKSVGVPFIRWQTTTDGDGRFVWNGAPATPQLFFFSHPDYQTLHGHLLAPQDADHKVILLEGTKIVGIVTDASTGERLDEFFVLPALGSPSGLRRYSPHAELRFRRGKFEFETKETDHNVLRFRANGYLTKIVPLPPPHAGALQIELEPGKSFTGTVINKSGQFITGAEVMAVQIDDPQLPVLEKGRVSSRRSSDHTVTEADGSFTLAANRQADVLLVVSPAGFAEMPVTALTPRSMIVLSPWGKIAGLLTAEGKPLVGEELILTSVRGSSFQVGGANVRSRTDGAGRFSFDVVPPRLMQLGRLVPLVGDHIFDIKDKLDIHVAPGEVTKVSLSVGMPLESEHRNGPPTQPAASR